MIREHFSEKINSPGTILVTAFGPFGEDDLNPSELVLERLPGMIGGFRVEKLILPVEFVRSRELAFKKYNEISPDAVIMLGQAGKRRAITPETTGKNIMNSVRADNTVPDNSGFAPDHLPIAVNGPDELKSTLPIDKIIEAIGRLDIPAERSDSAGEYVCNCLLYGMLDHNRGSVPTGFIHMPYIREQGHTDQPFMELDDICKGIVASIEAVAAELGS